jgi:hypothetical protein
VPEVNSLFSKLGLPPWQWFFLIPEPCCSTVLILPQQISPYFQQVEGATHLFPSAISYLAHQLLTLQVVCNSQIILAQITSQKLTQGGIGNGKESPY